MVVKPNRFKLYCPVVYLNGNIIDYVEKTKYLGYMFTNDKQDDVEIDVKETRSVLKFVFISWMKTIHYPNVMRSHLVTIAPMAPFTPKSTSKL